MNKINDNIGNKLSDWLSNMNSFWIMLVITLMPLLFHRPSTIDTWIQYLSSSVFQAVALVVINYTTKKQGDIQAIQTKETHDTTMEELQIIKGEQLTAKEERDELKEILDDMKILIVNKTV